MSNQGFMQKKNHNVIFLQSSVTKKDSRESAMLNYINRDDIKLMHSNCINDIVD